MNSNQLPVSGGLAVFFAVIIGYFVIDPSALDGFRPGGESSQIEQVHGIEDVQARLWQDPFAAAARHKSSHKAAPAIQLTGKIYIPVPTPENNTSQMKPDKDMSQKIDLHSEAGKKGKAEFEKKRHSLERLQSEICEEAAEQAGRQDNKCNSSDSITVLAVMVSAGPYAKPAETRKRMRYAVLSGLGIADYYPKDAEHIGYVDDLNTSLSIINGEKKEPRLNLSDGDEQLPHVMPYEWYEKTSENDEKHVLLLWLDEDAFSEKPLTKLDMLFASLGKHVTSIKMIGPYGSTLLKAMATEAKKGLAFATLKEKVDVFSATATAVDSELVGTGKSVVSILAGGGGFHRFKRTIATDGELADKLVRELQLRMKPKEAGTMDYHVAIVSEWDTVYGRALPKIFASHYKKGQLLRFTYMRGIDGALAAGGSEIQNKNKAKADEAEEGKRQGVAIERPEGRSQKDYLRRLATQISRTDEKLKASGKNGIRAIGVLGSDVYDKLLILRVLRERFPKAVFFTTDLDAALLHPDQFPWTRNMVVASAYSMEYDIQTKRRGEFGLPPFRDSYQTSVFRSARLALGEKTGDASAAIYEIERNGAFPLGRKDSKNWVLISRLTTAFLLFIWLAVLFWRRWVAKEDAPFATVSKAGFFRRLINRIGKLVWWLLVTNFMISVAVAVGVNFFAADSDLYLGAFVLAVQWIVWLYLYFYLKIWRMQRVWELCSLAAFLQKVALHKEKRLYQRVFYVLGDILWIPYALVLKPLSYAREVHLAIFLFAGFLLLVFGFGDEEPFSLFSGISIWPTELIRLVAIWLAFFLLWRAWKHMEDGRDNIENTLGVIGALSGKRADIRVIWDKYNAYGSLRERIKRIWLPAAIWVLICLLIYQLQSPNIPFRGEVAYWADIGIGGISIGVFFLLFCFVVDASLHCQDIIKDLIQYNTRWSFMRFCEHDMPKKAQLLVLSVKREWKEIRLIAMRTDDISKTVYYPIYVILLLLAAQSDYFDNWDMPYPLVLIATVNVSIVLWAAIMLRRKAVEARGVSLDKIHHIESQALAIRDNAVRKQVMRKLHFYKAEIENIREGAFLPISEQPWLRALTLMGGGGGSLLLLQAMAG